MFFLRIWDWGLIYVILIKKNAVFTEPALHRCSYEKVFWKMQPIYRRTLMPKCDFNKAANQLYWNHSSAWVFSFTFVAYKNTFGGLLLHLIILKISVIHIVINIIGNFLIKAFSLMVLRNWVTETVLTRYQLYSAIYLIKITQINIRDKLNTAVKYKVNV